MADALFEEPRLAEVYDLLDPVRPDLDVYAALVGELPAHSVLDVAPDRPGREPVFIARRVG